MIELLGVIFLIISAFLFIAGYVDQTTPAPWMFGGVALLFGLVCLLGSGDKPQSKATNDAPQFIGTVDVYQRRDGSRFIELNK